MSTTGPSTVRRPLRIHVQESASSLDVFIVTESRLRSQPATRQRLSGELDVSHGAIRVDLDRGLQTAEVMLVDNFATDQLLCRAAKLKWIQSSSATTRRANCHVCSISFRTMWSAASLALHHKTWLIRRRAIEARDALVLPAR
jgi:hypothetical protein